MSARSPHNSPPVFPPVSIQTEREGLGESRAVHAAGDSGEEDLGASWLGSHAGGRSGAVEARGRKKKSESDLRRAARRAEQRAKQEERDSKEDACTATEKDGKGEAEDRRGRGKRDKTDQVDREERDMLRLSRAGDLEGVKNLLGVTISPQGYKCMPDKTFLLNCKDTLQRPCQAPPAMWGEPKGVCPRRPNAASLRGSERTHRDTGNVRGGANVHALVHRGRRSALHFACKNAHLNAALLLVQYGGDLDLENAQGETPLNGLSEEIQGLLRQAATVAVKRGAGSSKSRSKLADGKAARAEEDSRQDEDGKLGEGQEEGAEPAPDSAARMIGPLLSEEAAARISVEGSLAEDGDIRRKREREEDDDEHESKKERRIGTHEERKRPAAPTNRARLPVICAAQDDED
ncbi:putative protamine P1 [Neospora caninum Liverpool]|uniref:Putative protamine P1 n=1 Tax=Neospora caninum (strain Liverpool) TaxID=572307 RepID=F0VKY8_NEOCL|nr:putative protamine P1 [Neospora caninum Liverpool]CBZ54740.1 putative protamine P1 [Neospora caninum Liverpool]|eukprot:XP_003884768.1 putative protamine P1 [Neospora caninum Liverpool]